MPISIEDRMELHELAGRYGDAIDDRAWDRLAELFTQDAVFELRGMEDAYEEELSGIKMEGLQEIKSFMAAPDNNHPPGHFMTNVHVDEIGHVIQLSFRGIFPLPHASNGEVGNKIVFGSYWDRVVKTESGWRIQHKVFSLKRLADLWN